LNSRRFLEAVLRRLQDQQDEMKAEMARRTTAHAARILDLNYDHDATRLMVKEEHENLEKKTHEFTMAHDKVETLRRK